jgi:signal transduction histidine kinase
MQAAPNTAPVPVDKPNTSHPTTFFQRFWDNLTRPSANLKTDDQPRARLLAAMLALFLPLATLTIFITPMINVFSNRPVTSLTPGIILGYILIPTAYILSRTRYYSLGAWFAILSPVVAVVTPVLTTGILTSIVPLFYLTLSVIIAGLLLTSRDTLIIGFIIAGITALMPQVQAPGVVASATQNVAAVSFVLITTGITVLVGRIRESTLKLLEQSRIDLSNSLAQTEEARQRAERSDQVKSAFLASMSHELRTPLNSIINFTEFVADGDTGPITDQQKGLLTQVVGSGKHLLNLINDVLDMSKIEAGSLNLFIEDDVDLNAILNRVVNTGRGLIKDKTVEIKLDSAEDLPLIRGDQQRILQILLNIVSNACKFTEKGDIKVNARKNGAEVVISVADTGPGIAAEDVAIVFEPFKQTKAGLRQVSGTGLGMPIAKNLTEAHGGRLWLESTPGKGANFFVALPIKSEILTPAT